MTLVNETGFSNFLSAFQSMGMPSYGNQTFSFIEAIGNVKMNGTVVSGNTKVNGSLQATSASLQSFEMNGSADLKNTTVAKDSKMNGTLRAENCSFLAPIQISTNLVHLSATSIIGIYVLKPMQQAIEKQRIILENTSTINGNIIFESGEGEVLLRGNSQINGNIIGGIVIQE